VVPGLFRGPARGSDLASLRTSAKLLDADSWIISGQKTWTTNGGKYADWIFRTRPPTNAQAKKQEGISFFLVDHEGPPGLQ